jgi:hypothetical protein
MSDVTRSWSYLLHSYSQLIAVGKKFIGYCATPKHLFCESEPLLTVAQTPLPKSSVARLSPSIILVNSKLCVRVAGVPAPIGS